jgi:CheY-like chemotaxis protein
VEPGAYAELAVRDRGQGIPPQQLPHIFEPFYTTKAVGVGTGLGLATVEGIVSQSAGHIQVESTVGKGTTIRILLPLTAEATPASPAGAPGQSRGRPRGRILLVDDEDSVRTIIARTLQAEGYEVIGAREGREALRELDQIGGAVDLVLTDLQMPGMGGAQLGRELAQRYPDLPLVWISGHPRELEFPRELPGKDQPFLMKPVAPDALLDTVAEVMENAARSEEG